MSKKIPTAVIAKVAKALEWGYTHSGIDTLFMGAGAPEDHPLASNKVDKCHKWMSVCNNDSSIDALKVLGKVIMEFMNKQSDNENDIKHQCAIKESLAENQLSYRENGTIVAAGAYPAVKTIEDFLKEGDFPSVEEEFERSLENIGTDPQVAVTAACAIIESACKIYIDRYDLDMPSNKTVTPLWKVVREHIKSNMERKLKDELHKIFGGLSTIAGSVGAIRTNAGSAHGRGAVLPQITATEARLAVNAAHTMVVFIMEKLPTKSVDADAPF